MASAWGACRVFLYNWQTLIAGGISLLAGLMAFVGALFAAHQQVKAAQQAAKDQVAAMQRQLDDERAARAESDRRRLSVVQWAVKVEARRLAVAALLMKGEASAPDGTAGALEQLLIETSPLLRGEREDMALLDDETRALLHNIAVTLDGYNLSIKVAKTGTEGRPHIAQRALELIVQLEKLADELHKV